MSARQLALALCTLSLGACATRPALPLPLTPLIATARRDLPAPPALPSLAREVSLPEVRSFALANGLRAYVVVQPEAADITIAYVARAGGENRDLASLGLSTLVMRSARHTVEDRHPPRQGGALSAEAPARMFARRDAALILATAHAGTLEPVFAELGTTLSATELTQDAVRSAVSEQLDQLHDGLYDQGELARLHAMQMLYGDTHPLGHATIGRHENMLRFKVDELEPHRRAILAPNSSALLVVGNVDAAAIAALSERHLGALPAEPSATTREPPRRQTERRARALLTPGRIAHIVQAFRAPARDHVDSVPFRLLSILTGELPSGRLWQSLREEREQTYSVISHYDARRDDGTFSIETEVSAEVVGETLDEIEATLERLRTARVAEHELARAKLHARERIAIALESGEGTAALMIDLLVDERALPADAHQLLERELARIDAVTLDDVQRVAKAYLWSGYSGVTVAGPLGEYVHVLDRWCNGNYDIFVPKRIADSL